MRRCYDDQPPFLPPRTALISGTSTSDAAITQSRSESYKTPDIPVEKKRKLSEEQATTTLKSKAIPSSVEKQTPDLAGLVVDDICLGNGKKAHPRKMVTVHYTAKLQENGSMLYSTHGKFPHQFRLGVGGVIPGLDIGVIGMCVGGRRKITGPPAMGHGAEGYLDFIPPNAWLVYDVELIKVK
ncbi:hypothetical protein CARUB_v10003102mg [Capsella rubella]|uniref:peptidylprolyl isomerase n=2 Tax=Capsella rubella TaxID=81985 RepID=R0GZU1_9BRAS|nr:hypothetical protein CARUB_v10003102mg [Capsella rubella]